MPLYSELAKLAARVLVPGGWLLAYSGIAFLNKVFTAMEQPGLIYGWTFALMHAGPAGDHYQLKLRCGWKAILAYYRPPLAATWSPFRDVVRGGGRDKDLHKWQQSLGDAEFFIQRMCPPGGFVFDPFCCTGTSLVAAKQTGRRWLGFEINEENASIARARLANMEQSLSL